MSLEENMDESFSKGKYIALIERLKRIRPREEVFVTLKFVSKALVRMLSVHLTSLSYKRNPTLSIWQV